MNITKSIKEVLHRKGLSQTDFAIKCGMSQSQLSTLMSSGKCKSTTLETLAEEAGMEVSAFIKLGED